MLNHQSAGILEAESIHGMGWAGWAVASFKERSDISTCFFLNFQPSLRRDRVYMIECTRYILAITFLYMYIYTRTQSLDVLFYHFHLMTAFFVPNCFTLFLQPLFCVDLDYFQVFLSIAGNARTANVGKA